MASILADLSLRITAQVAELQKGIQSAKEQVKSFQTNVKKLNSDLKAGFKDAASNVGQSLNIMTGGLSGLMSTGVQAFKTLASSVKGFASAFMATGIGAIIAAVALAIGGLVAAFKRSGEAADKMEEVLGFLRGVLDYFIGQLVKVGEWLIKAFSDPKEAIKDLWNVIKENLVTRFQGVIQMFTAGWEIIKNGAMGAGLAIKGIFDKDAKEQAKQYFDAAAEGAKKVGEAVVMITTGKTISELKEIKDEIIAAGKTGLGLAQQEDALMDKQIKNTVELARMETKLAQTREQLAGEAGKTEESRLKRQELLNSIMSQMDAISRRRIDYAYEEWKLLEAQAKAASDTSDDTRLKIAQAQANYENEVARASEEVLRFKKQEATVDAQIAADIAKQAENEKAYQNELMKLEQENTLLKMKDARLVAETKLQYEKENALAEAQSAKERELIEANYLAKVGQLHDEWRTEDLEKAQTAAQTRLAKELENDKLTKDQRLASLEELHTQGLVKDQEYEDAKTAILQAAEEQRAQITQLAFDAALSITDTLANLYEAAKNRELRAAGDNAAKKEQIEKKYAEKQKKISIAQAIINGALAITKAFADLGPIAGAITSVLVAASTAAQIAVISSQSFAKGGLVYGETLATVGDYPSASVNPEVIAPLNKLQKILAESSSNQVLKGDVRFVIEQNQLVGILNDYNRKNIYF